jgi:hypothetical protein
VADLFQTNQQSTSKEIRDHMKIVCGVGTPKTIIIVKIHTNPSAEV